MAILVRLQFSIALTLVIESDATAFLHNLVNYSQYTLADFYLNSNKVAEKAAQNEHTQFFFKKMTMQK